MPKMGKMASILFKLFSKFARLIGFFLKLYQIGIKKRAGVTAYDF